MKKRIVVTGMGIVSPVGIGLDRFWSALQSGECGIGPITRFDSQRCACQIAGEVKDFDAKQYMDNRLVQRTAIFTQYALVAAMEAWKQAKLDEKPMLNPERTAVILGNGIGGLEVDSEAHRRLLEKGPSRMPAMTIPKMISNEAPANISMLYGIRGAGHSIVTACASGTDAMGHALDLLRVGRYDMIVSGGCEATINEFAVGSFCALKALSTHFNDCPEKASRPFDKDRDGFVMGEGSGILIFETLEHARMRGAEILAEVAGYGASSDAYHLTAPDPDGIGATQAIRQALEDAEMSADEIDYINAHGTSTPTNDPVETRAIKRAFGQRAYELKISSTKGMTGHCLGAAGALEAVVCIQTIRDHFCPATLNLENPDPECDLNYLPNQGISANINAALSTSLGFGGHNGALIFKRFND